MPQRCTARTQRNRLSLVGAILLTGGCQSHEATTPQDTQVAPRVTPAPAAASAAPRETYLTPQAVARCIDLFVGPYTNGDSLLQFPTVSNDLERIINQQVISANSRTIAKAAQADDASAERDSLWEFRRALGPNFNPDACPAIESFITVAFTDAKRINTTLKKRFGRPRPNEADPAHPKLNPSYPGGHATTAGLRYRLLTAITDAPPDTEIELFKQAWFMGYERIAVNMHHATDVAAGFVLGEMVADEVLKQAQAEPNGHAGKALAAAKAEWKLRK